MPPDRFEVDLTSVCVRRGAVQLPFRLKDAFSEGAVTAVDADGGSALELSFRAPRELAGLGPFFEAHALRANDSVGLVFTGEGVQLQAIRRERGSARPRSHRGTTDAGTAGGRSAPPATASPGGVPGVPESSSPTEDGDSAPRSAASPTPPSLRLEVPRASEPAAESGPPAGSGSPRWQPLDVTVDAEEAGGAPEPASQARAGESGIGRVVVRKVRRSPEGLHSDDARAPELGGTPQQRRSGQGEVEPTRHDASHEPAAEQGGTGLFGLARRLGRGRGGNKDPQQQGGTRGGGGPASSARPATEAGDAGGPRPRGVGPGRPRDMIRSDDGDAEFLVEGAPAARAEAGREVAVASAASASVRPEEGEPTTPVDEDAWQPDALRGDIAAVRSYLAAPGVPAIVRTERVAEALGMSVSRTERALERVSEEWDHLSYIRPGAYMLRRPSEG